MEARWNKHSVSPASKRNEECPDWVGHIVRYHNTPGKAQAEMFNSPAESSYIPRKNGRPEYGPTINIVMAQSIEGSIGSQVTRITFRFTKEGLVCLTNQVACFLVINVFVMVRRIRSILGGFVAISVNGRLLMMTLTFISTWRGRGDLKGGSCRKMGLAGN